MGTRWIPWNVKSLHYKINNIFKIICQQILGSVEAKLWFWVSIFSRPKWRTVIISQREILANFIQLILWGKEVLYWWEYFFSLVQSWDWSFHLQDLFHSTVHRLKASGITQKLVDDYLNAEPYIPLPKKNKNKPLVLEQLIMLWIICISGLAIGLFVFMCELVAGCFAKHLKQKQAGRTNRQDQALKPSRESQGGTLITELDWI